jgi:hypothetical protein
MTMEEREVGAWLLRSVQRPSLPEDDFDLMHLGALEIVALTTEYRRLAAGGHNHRVGQWAALLAKQLDLPERVIDLIRTTAPLHDLGAIYIPSKILLKPSKLLPEEFEVVKGHVNLGLKLLGQGQSESLRMARLIVETHHERFDGLGYPKGLKGVQIPLIGQIVTVADVFDVLTHDQPYRKAFSKEQALFEIQQQQGMAFDPQVVAALVAVNQESYWLARPGKDKDAHALLEGRLDILNLFELLSSLTQNKTSGQLTLEFADAHGKIWLENGNIIHADIPSQQSEEALFSIFSQAQSKPHTRFVLTQPALPKPTIQRSTQQLLFDMAIRLDHRLRKNES